MSIGRGKVQVVEQAKSIAGCGATFISSTDFAC
jgi:hypothetical protein